MLAVYFFQANICEYQKTVIITDEEELPCRCYVIYC